MTALRWKRSSPSRNAAAVARCYMKRAVKIGRCGGRVADARRSLYTFPNERACLGRVSSCPLSCMVVAATVCQTETAFWDAEGWRVGSRSASSRRIDRQEAARKQLKHQRAKKQVTHGFALRVRHVGTSRRMGSDFGGRHYLRCGLDCARQDSVLTYQTLHRSCTDVEDRSVVSRYAAELLGSAPRRIYMAAASPLPSWGGATNDVPSRQSAKRMPASRRASATTATYFPRRADSVVVHRRRCSAFGVGRERKTDHAHCTSR